MIEAETISIESKMNFKFSNKAIKYDETAFFKSLKKNQDKIFIKNKGELKGVDFITYDINNFLLIEVKNYEGYENSDIDKLSTKDCSENDLGYVCMKKFKDSLYGVMLSLLSNKSDVEDLKTFIEDFFKFKNLANLNEINLIFILTLNYNTAASKVKHHGLHLENSLKPLKNRMKSFFSDIKVEVDIHLINQSNKYKNFYEIVS